MISLFLTLALGWQDNPPPKAEPPKKSIPAARIQQLQPAAQTETLPGFADIKKSYDRLVHQSMEFYTKAKTEEERDAAGERSGELFQKEGKPLVEKAMAMARPQAADKKAVPVLVWILQSFPFDPQADEAADLMLKHHPRSKELFEAAHSLTHAATDWSIRVMKAWSETADSTEEQAKAKYYLAEMYHSLAERAANIQRMDEKTVEMIEKKQGKAYLDLWKKRNSQALDAQAEKLLEEIVAKHANVKMYYLTLGEAAKSQLFEIRHLSIGKPAPEITGEDIDGKPMKLSDYRGKVVVLDFWGFW